jgi:hypothetical protein
MEPLIWRQKNHLAAKNPLANMCHGALATVATLAAMATNNP